MPTARAPSLQDLQGEWKIVRVGKNGNRAPFFIPWLIKIRFHIDGDHYTKIARGEVIEEGRLIVTPHSDLSHIDEHIETGADSGKKHLGIIRLLGRKLEHLQADINDPRPSGFPYDQNTRASMALMKPA